ncbi:MAG: DNA repair exonuclease [Lachnospira sp.]|nr:DNA repair exonuclease [Lachnospira sp.]
MKFIHVGDAHLGAMKDKLRAKEIWATLKKIIKVAKDVDLLMFCGDIFHRQPLLSELKELNYLFSTIPNTEVVLIAGNHDFISEESYYKTFNWNDNVHFIKSDTVSSIYLENIKTTVYGASYHTREIKENIYEGIKAKGKGINILMAHGGDEAHIPFDKNALLNAGFDYVALGHIHKPEIFADGRMAYAGGIEPLDINDIGDRGYILGEIGKHLRIEFVRACKRIYIPIKIECDESFTNEQLIDIVSDEIAKKGKENIYKVIINGIRDLQTEFDLGSIKRLGNIESILDETITELDYEKILAENENNIIGEFIRTIGDTDEKALYYGVKALWS